ncbi:hypothetical protein D3C73_1200050 [compost metagenome]
MLLRNGLLIMKNIHHGHPPSRLFPSRPDLEQVPGIRQQLLRFMQLSAAFIIKEQIFAVLKYAEPVNVQQFHTFIQSRKPGAEKRLRSTAFPALAPV